MRATQQTTETEIMRGRILTPYQHDLVKSLLKQRDLLFQLSQLHHGPVHLLIPQIMDENIARMRDFFTNYDFDTAIHYTMKPNKSDVFARQAYKNGLNIDVSSLAELQAALGAGFKGDQIGCTNTKNRQYLHMQVNGIDFLSFSGHKMFALGGIGALCVSPRIQESIRPLFFGGSMAEYETGSPIHQLMEAGSLNMAGIVSMNAACRFILETHAQNPLRRLSKTLYEKILSNPRLDLLYEQKSYALEHLSAIAAFTLEGIDSGELSDILAEHGIYVRAGRHCAGVRDSVRISLQLYNTEEEVENVCTLLEEIGNQLG